MSLSRASVLFYDDPAYRQQPIVGGPWLIVRDAAAYEFDGRFYVLRKAHQQRRDLLGWSGQEAAGALSEPAGTQLVAAPFDFDAASWNYNNGLDRADAVSVIESEVASRLFTVGATSSQAILDGFGTYGPTWETASWIVEAGSYPSVDMGMFDVTTGEWAQLARLTFATGAIAEIAGVGTSRDRRVFKLMDSGPNWGGPVYLVRLYAARTAGNARAMYTYVNSGPIAAGSSVFLHYKGWENTSWGSNPFSGSRLRDDLTAAPIPVGVPFAGCFEYVAGEVVGMGVGARVLLHIGDGSATDPRFVIDQDDNSNNIVVRYDDGTTDRSAVCAASFYEGERVVVTWMIDPDDGTLRAQARVGKGDLASDASATGGMATSWGGTTPRLRVGHASSAGADPCRLSRGRLVIFRSADLDDVTDHQAIYTQLSQFRLDAAGRMVRRAA